MAFPLAAVLPLLKPALGFAWNLFTKKKNRTPSTVSEILDFTEKVVKGEEPVTSEERKQLIEHLSVVEETWGKVFEAYQETERAMVLSEDKFTKRARPMRIYAAILIILFANVVYPLIMSALALFGKIGWSSVSILEIPWYIYAVFLGDFATYAFVRSKYDKRGLKSPNIFGSLAQMLKG